VALQLIENHTKGCVQRAIAGGEGDDAVDELIDILGRFTR
jgi:DNA-binding FrmR family transcriptional regulator